MFRCQRIGNALLKPKGAERKQISIRNMGSSQLQNGLCEERMQMIVVDDFSALDDAGIGPGLRRSPSARLCGTNRDKIAGFITGKSVSLGCRNTYFPVKGPVCLFFGRRGSRNADAIIPGRNLTHNPILLSEEEGQYQRQYQRQILHQRKYSLFFAPCHHRRMGT